MYALSLPLYLDVFSKISWNILHLFRIRMSCSTIKFQIECLMYLDIKKYVMEISEAHQIRPPNENRGSLFRACFNKGVGRHLLGLAETQRQS